jgi:hypothetical protein
MSLRDALLARRRERQDALPGQPYIAVLDGPARFDFEAFWFGLPDDSREQVFRLVSLATVDEDGKPVLTEEDARAMDHDVLMALYRAAFRLNRLGAQGVAEAKGESEPSPSSAG